MPTRAVALAVVVVLPFWSLVPLPVHTGPWQATGIDALLLVLIGLSGRGWRQALAEPTDIGARVAAGFAALLLGALLVHPSAGGALTVLRAYGALCLWLAIRGQTRREAERLLGVLVVLGAFQGGLALVQIVLARPLGAGLLTAASWPLYEVGGIAAPRGTFQHPYPLAAFSMVATFAGLALVHARGRLGWVGAGAAFAAVPLGITFSRSAALGLACGLAVVVLCVRPRTAVVVVGTGAVALGALGPMLLWRGGWEHRVQDGGVPLSTGGADYASAHRLYLAGAAISTIRAHPATGVGPGRVYPGSSLAAKAAPKYPQEIVHNLWLFVAAEAGVLAGGATLAMVVGTGRGAFRRSPAAFALFTSLLPFVLLDRLTYDGAHGFALTALWLGTVGVLSRTVAVQGAGRLDRPRRRPPGTS